LHKMRRLFAVIGFPSRLVGHAPARGKNNHF